MSDGAFETEATLVIRSADPEAVIRAIGALRELAGRELVPEAERVQCDRYYDTPDEALQRGGCALRVRERDGRRWIAFKGAPEIVGAAVRRSEIEGGVGDRETRAAIVEKLRVLGLEGELPDPATAVGSGWREVQSRETRRRPYRLGTGEAPLAELVVDSVSYRFGGRSFRHHEVEIEALSDAGGDRMDELVRALEARIGAALQRWTVSKLDLGRRLEKLVASRGASGLAGPAGDLLPSAYDLLSRGD